MPRVTNIWGAASSVLAVLAAVLLALTYLVGVGTRPADAAGPTRSEVATLDPLWAGSIGRDISEAGPVAGQGQNPAGQARAFLWEDGKATVDLGLPAKPPVPSADDFSRARGINDDGAVVGEWRIGRQPLRAFLYEGGQMKDLNALIPGYPEWSLSGAQAINESGQVVGAGVINRETHAFLYENGTPTDLGKILGDPYSAAWGINDRGDVVGGTGSTALQSEAFVIRNGAVEMLGKYDGFPASEAVGINNSGKVIGWSFNPGQNPPQSRAFLYDDSDGGEAGIEPLDPLPDDVYTRARDLDEAGRVVGWSRNDVANSPQSEQFSATLWEGGQVKDLNELIPADSGWKLVDAYAINESGQITGSGYKDGRLQAFLLNPVYDFSGFFAPVDNPPTVNAVKAGRAVPVKFSLSGDQGLGVVEESYPRSEQVPCDAADPVDGIEETTSANTGGLTYDAAADEYSYVWKTDKAWTGCRQLVLKLDDGTVHRATFDFSN